MPFNRCLLPLFLIPLISTPADAREIKDCPLSGKNSLLCSGQAERGSHSPGSGQNDAPDFLSALEKKIWHEINRARANPGLYASFLEAYLGGFEGENYRMPDGTLLKTKEGKSAVVKAIEFLKKTKPVAALQISRGLSGAAADHVRDHGPLGMVGHRGSSGSSPAERAQRYGMWEKSIAEISTYGHNDPRQIVISFIVDDGVPDRGHRKDLFNPVFRVVGISFGPHRHYQCMCVVDLAAGFSERIWR